MRVTVTRNEELELDFARFVDWLVVSYVVAWLDRCS